VLAASDVLWTGWFGAVAAEAGPGKAVAVVGDGAKVFDLTLPLERAAEGYRAMDERRAIKVLLSVSWGRSSRLWSM
jgi:hypothetical protein